MSFATDQVALLQTAYSKCCRGSPTATASASSRERMRAGSLRSWTNGSGARTQRLPRGRWLAWDKLGGKDSWDSFSDVEFVWVNKPGAARIFRLMWKGLCQGAGKDKNVRRTPRRKSRLPLLQGAVEDHDPDSGLLHAAHAAWNALAVLELMLRSRARTGGPE